MVPVGRRNSTFYAIDQFGFPKNFKFPKDFQETWAQFANLPLDLAHLGTFWLSSVGIPANQIDIQRFEMARACGGQYRTTESAESELDECQIHTRRFHGKLLQDRVLQLE